MQYNKWLVPSLFAWLACASWGAAKDIEATPDNVRQKVSGLQPGDTLVLTAGKYNGGITLKQLHGRADAPITIRGMGAETVLLGVGGTNTIDILDCQYLVLRDLTFDGRGKEVDAIKAKYSKIVSHHVTIENNTIMNHGANQQIVGISTKAPAADWTIRGNTVIGAGTGLYLGNSTGGEPFVRGIIEYNLVTNPVGYCVQIKKQNPRPAAQGLPTEPSTTIIRYNVFIKSDRPSPDGNRPNLLVGGYPDDGPGSRDRYQIYGNVLCHNPRESLFQGTGRVSMHDNVFVDCPGTGVMLTTHDHKPVKQALVYHNTFVDVGNALTISGNAVDGTVIAGNLSVAAKKPSQPWPEGNVALSATQAATALTAPVGQLGKLDVQPRKLILSVVPAAALDKLRLDTDYNLDFWGAKRTTFEQAGACQPSSQPRPIGMTKRDSVAKSQRER